VSALNRRQSAKTLARRTLLAGLQRLTQRTAVLLPPEAGLVDLLDVRAPYRIDSDQIHYDIHAPVPGRLDVRLLTHVEMGHAPVIASFDGIGIERDSQLTLRLVDGSFIRDEVMVGEIDPSKLPRRFTTELVLHGHPGGQWTRRVGHYQVRDASDEAYFTGSHYRDYERQATGDVARTLDTLRAWNATSPLLEVGCATGLLLRACADVGFDVMGVDVSRWAVEHARARLSEQQVILSDAAAEVFPAGVTSRRFRTVVMNAVLEHVQDPAALVARTADVVEPGGLLFLTTANANSLTRWLFGVDWEGLSDPTHKSAHAITPDRLRDWLEAAGWRVEHLTTHSVWDDNPDPVHATLRDVAAADARFRQLLVQYQRGDFLECIARRRPS
jgi:2-polyprenyl-3-methyl-5-hydroxy-6-metoxy-1,4-benzoquinol methylase